MKKKHIHFTTILCLTSGLVQENL